MKFVDDDDEDDDDATVFFYRAAYMQGSLSHERNVCPYVRPSVCLSNTWTVTKRKKVLPRFLYHMKEHDRNPT